jgi:hypothetical protein
MTLGDVVEYDGGSSAFNTARRSFATRTGSPADPAAEAAAPAETAGPGGPVAFAEADRSIAEDGTDLLSAYIARRHATLSEG